MNRRDAGRNLLFGALAVATPVAVLAQDMGRPGDRMGRGPGGPMGDAEQRHAVETLRIGGLALQTSQLAERRATRFRVKEFAGFEVAEQTTIADIIRETTGMAPPPPDAMARATLARLTAARGPMFDMAYVRAQTDGHQQLLDVQERYLSSGRDPHMRHVAMLARGQIKEHLKLLGDIQAGRA